MRKQRAFAFVANLKMLGLEYQHTGLATTRALIKSQPDLVRNVMKAYVEGIHYYKTNRQESLTVLVKYLKTNNAEALKEIHADIGLALVPAKPYPTLKGIDAILREVGGRSPKQRQLGRSSLSTCHLSKNWIILDFIDRLYKTKPIVVADKPPRLPVEPVDYAVKAGDTLSDLAEWFYGSPLSGRRFTKLTGKLSSTPITFISDKRSLFLPRPEAKGFPSLSFRVRPSMLFLICFSFAVSVCQPKDIRLSYGGEACHREAKQKWRENPPNNFC